MPGFRLISRVSIYDSLILPILCLRLVFSYRAYERDRTSLSSWSGALDQPRYRYEIDTRDHLWT